MSYVTTTLFTVGFLGKRSLDYYIYDITLSIGLIYLLDVLELKIVHSTTC